MFANPEMLMQPPAQGTMLFLALLLTQCVSFLVLQVCAQNFIIDWPVRAMFMSRGYRGCGWAATFRSSEKLGAHKKLRQRSF